MKKFKFISVILITIGIITMIFTGCSEEKKTAIAAYDAEYSRIKSEQTVLEKTITDSKDLIKSNETPYDEETVSALETAISDAKASIIEIPKCKGNAEEINTLVNDKLKNISYIEANQMLTSAKTELENSIKIMAQLTNPNETFITERIKNIDGITGYASATEETDVNGLLNKPGGYTSVTYFSYSKVPEDEYLNNNSIVENGVEGGGGLEVFSNKEDAEKRNEYLASFDGSILATGSHTVVGTIVVRTSDNLTASQQKKLEEKIIANLIELR